MNATGGKFEAIDRELQSLGISQNNKEATSPLSPPVLPPLPPLDTDAPQRQKKSSSLDGIKQKVVKTCKNVPKEVLIALGVFVLVLIALFLSKPKFLLKKSPTNPLASPKFFWAGALGIALLCALLAALVPWLIERKQKKQKNKPAAE